jgi:YggT family protein
MNLAILLTSIIQLYTYLIIARVLGSWFVRDWSRGIPRFLWDVTEPVLGPARRYIPPLAGLDFSPVVVLFALYILSYYLVRI